jgi:hypothetical protein
MKKRITNIEQGMSNIEVMYPVYYKKTERSDIHSASGGSIDIRHSSFPEVSYEVSGVRKLRRFILTPEH